MTSLCFNRQVVAISESFVHKQFDFDTFNNDICLLRLETSVNLDYFTPACLPSSRLDQASLSVWITGEDGQVSLCLSVCLS